MRQKPLGKNNATHFENRYVADLLEQLGVRPVWSAPYKPSTTEVAEICVGRAKAWIVANDPLKVGHSCLSQGAECLPVPTPFEALDTPNPQPETN